MYRIVLLLFFLTLSLFALEDNVKILAKKINGKGDTLTAIGDVVIYSDRYVITSDRAKYNKKTKIVQLYGNINIIKDSRLFARSKFATLNLEDDYSFFSPLFLDDEDSDIWIRCDKANLQNGVYYTKKAIVSSCNVYDPDWKITYTSGDYSNNTKFVTLYNALFYIKNIPVLYTPYFRFSTDKTRRSGLLRPSFGYSSDDGLFYRQPIYFAPFKSWDFELDPQIRTRRGAGAYSTLRFADSPYSTGKITFGEFKEKSEYVKKYALKNSKHYGYEINYNRNKLFSGYFGEDAQDGLLIDYKYLNDVDYLNLQKEKSYITSSLITSKVNYFLQKDKDYAGLYFRYFKDTSKVSNDDTLQTLPKAQYHSFTKPIFFDNLLYSIDYKFNNYYRKTGINAKQNEILLPIIFTMPLLNDYLNFSVSENIYMNYISYSNDPTIKHNGQYLSNYHKFSLSSDLTKRYDDFIHTIGLSIDYIVPSFNDKKGYFADFIALNKEKKSINFQLEEFFYNSKGDLFLTHRLSQSYLFDEYDYKYGDLLNELIYKFSDKLSFTNNLVYSHKNKEVSEFQTGATYNGDIYDFSLLHTYKHGKELGDSNLITAKISTSYFSKYNYFANIDYDIKEGYTQNWEFGVKMHKKCWNYQISYKEHTTPILTSSGANSIKRRGIYLTVNFTPIGGIQYKFERDSGQEQ